jgi:hypothetical protein
VVHSRHHESSDLCAVISSVICSSTIKVITTNDLKARRNVFYFIIETVANDVSNVDVSVGLYRVVENLPNVRLLSMKPKTLLSGQACMHAASSLGIIQDMGAKHKFKFSAQSLAHLNAVSWCYI